MSRKIHMCLSVRGALMNWKLRDFKGMFRHDDGRLMTPQEAKAALLDELSKGHEVIPFGPVCEGFDYSGGGCQGHEDFHDDKPDGRPDLHTSTQPGDLDTFGRPLRPCS